MKKKISLKEQRNTKKAENKLKYQKAQAERAAAAQQAAAGAESEENPCFDVVKDTKRKALNPLHVEIEAPSAKKSSVKANGLKSLLLTDGKTVMTSFGRGSEANVEKRFDETGTKTFDRDPELFSAKPLETGYRIQRFNASPKDAGLAYRPAGVRPDQIGAKAALEKRYFGKETPGDNIHVQIAYQIQDIEKLLAVYISNIIYAVNNVTGVSAMKDSKGRPVDLLGDYGILGVEGLTKRLQRIPEQADEEAKALQAFLCSERLSYFGKEFCLVRNSPKEPDKEEKRQYKLMRVLCLLGELRQFLVHGKKKEKEFAWLYRLDRQLSQEYRELLGEFYDAQVDKVNKSFLTNSTVNLEVLFRALKTGTDPERKTVTQEYYQFTVRKEDGNLGFSLKTLREILLSAYKHEVRGKKYDSIRHKLYQLFSFALYHYYKTGVGAERREAFVAKLRAVMTAEAKQRAYADEAAEIWNDEGSGIRAAFLEILEAVDFGSAVKGIKARSSVAGDERFAEWLKEVRIEPEGVSCFTKLMYLLTRFLDGKEINELLTGLINKLENIQSFLDVMQQEHAETGLSDAFSFFECSGEIAAELRMTRSFARMAAADPEAKRFMVVDGAKLLGFNPKDTESEDEGIIRAIYGDACAEYLQFSEEEKEAFYVQKGLYGKKREKFSPYAYFHTDTSLRNFIAKNVVESARFRYVIRYVSPEIARKYARQEALVRFALHRVPLLQLLRYYQSCCGPKKDPDAAECVDFLAGVVNRVDFANFTDVRTRDSSKSEQEKKQKYQAIVGLYLTVVYWIVKNLVNVNSRYVMAFHILERDTVLLEGKRLFVGGMKAEDPFLLTDGYVSRQDAYVRKRIGENKRANRHGLNCVLENRNALGSDPASTDAAARLIWAYRNAVGHLTAVAAAQEYVSELREIHSYFEVYHYAMQRYLKSGAEFAELVSKNGPASGKIAAWANAVDRCHSFCKDWLWLLNVPFAYNPARYKNLSIANLFDKNEAAPVTEDASEQKEDE